MLLTKLKLVWILFALFLLCQFGRLYSQSTEASKNNYDTSSYIPSFYSGALDYNLMIAASKGYVSEVTRLIEEGADVTAESSEGVTPLVFAVSNNQTEVAKILIKFGSDVNKLTLAYETPLIIAVKNQNKDIAEALIREGANINFSDKYDATPLHYAAIYGYFELVDMLLYYDASVNIKSSDGNTPLMAATWSGYTDVADLLIQNGANLEIADNAGFTPFLVAVLNADTSMMNLLYINGANIYATNKTNHDALTISIVTGQNKVTEFLLRIGNEWTTAGRGVVNPYRVASKYRRKEMISILKNNNVPGQLKLEIDQMAITASTRFFTRDIYSGLSLSLKEPYLNAGIVAGCDTKLWYTRVLVKDSEHLFHQYMDKGSVVYGGFFKDFALTDRLGKSNYSISTSVLAGYSFSNKFKGTLIGPENKFSFIPAIDLKMTKMNFSVNLGLEYMKSEFYNNLPVWFRIGGSYNFFFDNTRLKTKTIQWY
jgi:ankyrin repeat protein